VTPSGIVYFILNITSFGEFEETSAAGELLKSIVVQG
jgi:hypothetical protein